ncbi:S-methyl-5-thioribose-1-phosphate isomerase [Sporichthya brevicatena]|uniref:Methylthioribose-1-phosphate isomerase n=1 Tax=Sporichthya brevicatena TaxID=171442 RepID=A0ABN1G6Y0_9ACTN
MSAPAPLRFDAAVPAVVLLDQTRLPTAEVERVCADVPALVTAIQQLAVRGAPLLGIAGGYGVALAAARGDDVPAAAQALATARPTAVNLATGVARVLAAWADGGRTAEAALVAADALAADEAQASAGMAEHGLTLVPEGARILTHCNTGALAVGGTGSAFAVALAAHRAGRLAHLWVDETRPLLQGSRLTAYEARRHGIPHSVLPDSAAAALMASGQVDLVITGADRVAADGAVANKVGTYSLAVLAAHHSVPFVVVAPRTTVDLGTADGAGIPVEQRAAEEVTHHAGTAVAPPGTAAFNPAFDVTPPDLVTALVTEVGVVRPVNRNGLARVMET